MGCGLSLIVVNRSVIYCSGEGESLLGLMVHNRGFHSGFQASRTSIKELVRPVKLQTSSPDWLADQESCALWLSWPPRWSWLHQKLEHQLCRKKDVKIQGRIESKVTGHPGQMREPDCWAPSIAAAYEPTKYLLSPTMCWPLCGD